jgi:membrane protein DedA with SNARE-associated domain
VVVHRKLAAAASVMHPLPLLAAVVVLVVLALRRRTLGRVTGALGVLAAAVLAGYGVGLYSLPSPDEALTRLAPALGNWTYPVVSVLAYLEAAAFVGLLVPGELTVVLGGAVARDGDVSIHALFALVWLAAVAGDTTGFLLGRRLGRAFLLHHGPRFHITPEIVGRVEGIFDRHGGKAIILGRFIGVARAITPFLAGSSHLTLRRFLAFDVVGAGAWAASFLAVGYVLAASASGAASLSHTIGLAIGGAAVAGGAALGIRLLYRSAPPGERLQLARQWARAALMPESDPKGP